MLVLNPKSRPKEVDQKLKPIYSLEGKRIGILNNRWKSWEVIIAEMSRQLSENHQVKSVAIYDIPLTSAASKSFLDDLALKSDFVIVGLAN
ncbi:hypothetical protein J2S00_003678 [Caldalkalibacillus uzonensis]|uniref:UGSC-like domain-containing protein n=1 Tax=Caldalkalibacillus uzonensis TaxID=353224 RepID=A0ABU0CWP2_9BACI|nr:hypothetical protein [Caldalkalibacillus uzonensis]MDQ0340838.1 hypothetical protein [Caldalkalibacillus uzonensis]